MGGANSLSCGVWLWCGWSQCSLLWCLVVAVGVEPILSPMVFAVLWVEPMLSPMVFAVVWAAPMLSPVVFAVVVWVEPMLSPVVFGWSTALPELWLFSLAFGQAQVLLISIPSSGLLLSSDPRLGYLRQGAWETHCCAASQFPVVCFLLHALEVFIFALYKILRGFSCNVCVRDKPCPLISPSAEAG